MLLVMVVCFTLNKTSMAQKLKFKKDFIGCYSLQKGNIKLSIEKDFVTNEWCGYVERDDKLLFDFFGETKKDITEQINKCLNKI